MVGVAARVEAPPRVVDVARLEREGGHDLEAIGRVEAARTEAVDDDWGGTESAIVLDPRFEEDALAGQQAMAGEQFGQLDSLLAARA